MGMWSVDESSGAQGRPRSTTTRAQEAAAMPMPTDIGVIDLMIGFPQADRRHNYDFLRANLGDRESLEDFELPAQYMFKNVPNVDPQSDPVTALLGLMDKYGIDRAMIGVSS